MYCTQFPEPLLGGLPLPLVRLPVLQLEHGIVVQLPPYGLVVRHHRTVLRGVPTLLLPPRPRHDLIVQVGRVSLDLEVVLAQVALHPELVDRRGVVHAHLLLLGVVPDAHAHVVAAALAPDVVGHLEADDEDAQVELAGPLAQGVRALGLVEAALARVVVRRVVHVSSLALTHLGGVSVAGVKEKKSRIRSGPGRGRTTTSASAWPRVFFTFLTNNKIDQLTIKVSL